MERVAPKDGYWCVGWGDGKRDPHQQVELVNTRDDAEKKRAKLKERFPCVQVWNLWESAE